MEKMNLLKEWSYTPTRIDRGYTRKTLYLNIGTPEMRIKDVSDEMIAKFTGGRGFDLKLLWDAVTENTKWNDPENEWVVAGGPLCGITQYPGSGKSYAAFISPLSEQSYDSNSGGYFGPLLKFSGFDALEIQGKADRDIIVYIDGDEGKIQIFESPLKDVNAYTVSETLHDYFAKDEADKRNISVICMGKAAETTFLGCVNASFYDVRRKAPRLKQYGRGGGGTVLRDKKVAALVVKYSNVKGTENNPVDVSVLQKTGVKLHKEIHDFDDVQCKMRSIGTAHLNEIMDEYNILPTHNFKFGQHPVDPEGNRARIHSEKYKALFTQNMPDGCWYGCSLACAKAVDGFELKTGPLKGQKVIVDGPEYETAAGLGSNIGVYDPEWTIEANFYADHYAMDTISLGTSLAFVCECFELGFLDTKKTNGLDLHFGNKDAMMELIHRMAEGKDDFALAVGKGSRKMKSIFAEKYGAPRETMEKIAMEGQGIETSQYMCKESIAQWGGYFLTLKGPQHDEAWLIFMDMVNKQIPSFEDKAEALHYFPNFRTWFSLAGLCKLPWNDIEPEDNHTRYKPQEAARVPEHVQNYVDIFNAVTGQSITKEDLISMSERVYNFQRLFQVRMQKGNAVHNIPDRALAPVFPDEWDARKEYHDAKLLEETGIDPKGLSTEEKIKKLQEHRRGVWQVLKDTVYKRRGWNRKGIPTLAKLKELGMDLPELVAIVEKYSTPEDDYR
jgi:aldehyde:ferredoxin oxidoreductase